MKLRALKKRINRNEHDSLKEVKRVFHNHNVHAWQAGQEARTHPTITQVTDLLSEKFPGVWVPRDALERVWAVLPDWMPR